MNDTTERRLVKGVETAGWALRRIAYVLEATVKGGNVAPKPCARCGSYLLSPGVNLPTTLCAVCELPTSAPAREEGLPVPDDGALITELSNAIIGVNNAVAGLNGLPYVPSPAVESAFNLLRVEQGKAIGVVNALKAVGRIK